MTDPGRALITGSSRAQGLGYAVARQLAEHGYHVILTSRHVERAEQLAGRLRADGREASAVALDLADPASVTRCAAEIADRGDALDVLVNNSSSVPDFDSHSVLEVDIDQAREAHATNVLGPWQLVQELLPLLRNAPAARIVNVSSADALQPAAPGREMIAPGFSMAKYALNALSTSLAAALSDTAILVNAVDPGTTATHPETGDEGDARSAQASAADVVWAARLPADGPTGGVFRDRRPLA